MSFEHCRKKKTRQVLVYIFTENQQPQIREVGLLLR